MIEKQSYVQAQGGGFAPVQNQHIPQQYTGFDAEKTISVISNFTQKIIKPMQDNAFLEGVTDSMVGAVEERSWLTQDQYMQGVNYNNFSNTLSGLNPKMAEQARASARDGDDVATFNKKIQPYLREANTELDKLGLTGKARELAQRQILEAPAQQLTLYQKEREEVTKFRFMKSMNETAANSFVTVASTGNFGQVLRDFDAQLAIGGSTEQNLKAVSATFTDNALTIMGNLNMTHDTDRQHLVGMNNFLASDEARTRFTASDIEKMSAKLAPKYKEASDALRADMGREVEAFELKVARGGYVSIDDFNNWGGKLDTLRDGRFLDAKDVETLRGKVFNLLTDSVKKQSEAMDIPQMKAADRAIQNPPVPDDKQTPYTIRNAIGQFGNTPAAFVAAVNTGINLQNDHTVRTAAGLLWKDAALGFTQDPSKVSTETIDGNTQAAIQTLYKVIRDTSTTNPLYMQSIADAIPDPNLREAVMIQANSGEAGNTIQQVQATMALRDRLKIAGEGDTTGLEADVVKFTEKNLKQGWFKGIFFTKDSQKSNYWNDMSEGNRSTLAGELNSMVANNKGALVKTGMPLLTAGQKAAALMKANLVHPVKNGIIPTTPSFNRAVSYNMGGKKVLLSNEQFTEVLDSMGDDVATKIAKGRGDRDNVRMAVEANQLRVTQFDDDGMPIGQKTYSAHELSKRAQELFDNKTAAAPPKSFMTVASGRDFMYLDERAAAPFGSGVVAKAVLSHLTAVEGIVNGVRDTRPAAQKVGSRYKDVPSTGIGVSMIHHPTWRAKFEAAGADPVKRGAVQSEFLNKYFTEDFNFQRSVTAMGLPAVDTPQAVPYIPVYRAITAMAYYAPKAGQVLQKALVQARDGGEAGYKQALASIKELPQYKAPGGNMRRQNVDDALALMRQIGIRDSKLAVMR